MPCTLIGAGFWAENVNNLRYNIMIHYLPQIIYLSLLLGGLFLSAYMHGKPKEGKHNFFTSFVATIIILLILYWGGFFNQP